MLSWQSPWKRKGRRQSQKFEQDTRSKIGYEEAVEERKPQGSGEGRHGGKRGLGPRRLREPWTVGSGNIPRSAAQRREAG
ncbi:hypothetical protein LIA77_08482 [Sarocladium implicatum]|nr:hypothetical protein LIA77_08482 [Sarocladium implicatum]